MDKYFMFAYGSNLNLLDFEKFCIEKKLNNASLKKIANAQLKGYALSWTTFSKRRNCGVLNIKQKEDASVWGVVYEVDAKTLEIFDKKEGHPNHYKRIAVKVETESGATIETYTYKAHPTHITENFWPNDHYRDIVIEGAKQQQLPEKYINDLVEKVPVLEIQASGKNKFRVAIYSGQGVGPETLSTWCKLFKSFDLGTLDILYSHEFTEENLRKYDLLILPGGGGLRICWGLGDLGKENLRNYLKSGGRLLGVCAGAYAISAHRQDYIGISPVKIVDFTNCCRGEAILNLEVTEQGSSYFNTPTNTIIPIIYHNGPVVYNIIMPEIKEFQVLASFKQELVLEKGTKGDMIGTPAVWLNNFGKGKVAGISPHIEKTTNHEQYLASFIINFIEIKK